MSHEPISRFPVTPREELPADLAERYADVEERSGFLPNVFAALAGGRTRRAPSSPCTTP